MEIQFLHEVGPVFLYGLYADTEVLGNFFVPVSLGNQFQNFSFPLGQGFTRCAVL